MIRKKNIRQALKIICNLTEKDVVKDNRYEDQENPKLVCLNGAVMKQALGIRKIYKKRWGADDARIELQHFYASDDSTGNDVLMNINSIHLGYIHSWGYSFQQMKAKATDYLESLLKKK